METSAIKGKYSIEKNPMEKYSMEIKQIEKYSWQQYSMFSHFFNSLLETKKVSISFS